MNPSVARFLSIATIAAAAVAPCPVRAQDNQKPIADVLHIDATVTADVVPDLAVVTLAIVREGPDVAPLTSEVNQTLTKAFAEIRAVPGVSASNGGYTTFPRYDSRGGQTTRSGWQVRAQIVVKSKDFNTLGSLVGRLGQSLQIAGSSFEISPELRAQESTALIERGVRAFQDKAQAATRAFGYVGYSVREVTVGSAGQSFSPRAALRVESTLSTSSSPLPIESGPVTLSVTVNGSVQMRK